MNGCGVIHLCFVLLLIVTTNCQDINAVKFYLYQRNGVRQQVKTTQTDIRYSKFNPRLKTYFLVHGWVDSENSRWMLPIKNNLLTREDCNVFNIDWSSWAGNRDLNIAARYTKRVGSNIAQFIKMLELQRGISRRDMHLIGFSLGGQVVGFAGEYLPHPQIGRITGLDSAEVGCQPTCLDSSDAFFVDEIHTKVSKTNKGHADFWVNFASKVPYDQHVMAPILFANSISSGSCSFKSVKCTDAATFQRGGCAGQPQNSMGLFATRPHTKAPNNFYVNANHLNPCV